MALPEVAHPYRSGEDAAQSRRVQRELIEARERIQDRLASAQRALCTLQAELQDIGRMSDALPVIPIPPAQRRRRQERQLRTA